MSAKASSFGKVNFGKAQLGDQRRTKRLVKLTDRMCQRPGGTLPQKFRDPADLKAFYRLMDCDDVTHEAILNAHRQSTLAKIADKKSTVLILHDATEMDFTTHKSLPIGKIGNGSRRGYIVQNSLAVDPRTRQVIGLCNQVLHRRANVRKDETKTQKRNRPNRESLLWLKGTQVLPNDQKLVDVCDRGADTSEFIEHEVKSGRRFVIRSSSNRSILVGHEAPAECQSKLLRNYARTLPEQGTWTLAVERKVEQRSPRKKGKKKRVVRTQREAKIAVSYAPIQIKPSSSRSGNYGNEPLKVWVLRAWEVDPPRGEKGLEWFLISNEPVKSFEKAYEVVSWYECRWLIEEYHKGMKTGCNIESPQFTTEARLQPAIALISVVTLTLLQMRDASRQKDAKMRKATEILCDDYVQVLSAWRHNKIRLDWTIHDFYYALARLGGHQNRKNDHQPGWQVIWEGWKELQAMVCGVDVLKQLKKCG